MIALQLTIPQAASVRCGLDEYLKLLNQCLIADGAPEHIKYWAERINQVHTTIDVLEVAMVRQ